MLGEREQIKSLGIAIGEADVKQRLLEKGQADLTGKALRLAKAEATLELAYEQSQNALGDYERTQDSYANASRRAEEATKALRIEVGRNFLPALGKIKGAIADYKQELADTLKAINDFNDAMKDAEDGLNSFAETEAYVAAQTELFRNVMEKDIAKISPKEFWEIRKAVKGLKEEGESSVEAFVRLQEEAKLNETVLENMERISKRNERLAANKEAIAAREREEQEKITAELEKQKKFYQDAATKAYKDMHTEIRKITDLQEIMSKYGMEYNEELELHQAAWGVLNSLLNTFGKESATVKAFLKDFGEYLEPLKEGTDEVHQSYAGWRQSLNNAAVAAKHLEDITFQQGDIVAEVSDELTRAEKQMLALKDATQNWGQVMLDIAASGYIDTFKELGSALRDGRDSGEAFADSMADIGRAIMRELPRLLFYAGVQLLGTPAWPAGLALIVASGLTALASGAMEDDTSASDIVNNSNGGGGSQNNTTIVYVEGSVVSEAELTNVVSNGQSQNYGRY
jgi:hypothetical protein